MKTETKISSIALVCALCAVVTTPAMSAAPVRSLGGAGTFSSASSAASSKTSGATSTRAGSLRVLPSTTKATTSTTTTTSKPESAGTATTSTRALATPRLSIGKYLPHRVVASTGGSSAGGTGDSSTGGVDFVDKKEWDDVYAKLPARVDSLEAGVVVLEDKVTDLEKTIGDADVTELQTIVNNLQTNVNTIVEQLPADGEEVASAESVTQINTTVTNINTTIEQLQEQITKIEGGDSSATIAGLEQSVETLQDDVSALKLDVLNVQGEFAKYALKTELEDAIKDAGDNSTAVATLRAEYEAKVAELEADIDELELALNSYYTKGEIDTQFASINDWLTAERRVAVETALIQLKALIGAKEVVEEYATVNELKVITDKLENIMAPDGTGMATKTELEELDAALTKLIADSDDALSESVLNSVQENLETDYYTKIQVDGMLAKKVDVSSLNALELQKTDTGEYKPLGALAYENEIKAEQITSINATSIQGKITTEQIDSLDASKITGEITNAQLASGAVTADKITTGDAALGDGDLAMLVSDGNGGVTWQSVGVATGSDGK